MGKASARKRARHLSKRDLLDELLNAHNNLTLVTDKHDPHQLATFVPVPNQGRSVVSHQMIPALGPALVSGQFNITEYDNSVLKHAKKLYVLTPTVPGLTIAGSGILPGTNIPSFPCDSLIAVKGRRHGWHIYSANASSLATKSNLSNPRQL